MKIFRVLVKGLFTQGTFSGLVAGIKLVTHTHKQRQRDRERERERERERVKVDFEGVFIATVMKNI